MEQPSNSDKQTITVKTEPEPVDMIPTESPEPTDQLESVAESVPEPVSEQPVAPPPVMANKQPWFKQRKIQIIIACVVTVVALAAGYAILAKKPAKQTGTALVQRRVAMGASVTVLDGQAQMSTDNTTWKDMTKDAKLEEGMYVRTADTARLVVTLDDGSAVRLNSGSHVRLNNLEADNVLITNLKGEVYTRVVESDRKFAVEVDKQQYVAHGTAYKTIHRDAVKGVEVYQSAIGVNKNTVTEGKQFFKSHTKTELVDKLSDIPLEQLQADAFVKWNLEHDKQASEFKDKLGYLQKLDQASKPAPAPAPAPKPQPVVTGISLKGGVYEKGATLSWSLNGVSAPNGFKIVKSLSANPVYGKDDAVFVDGAKRSYSWAIKDGKTYHFRVCVYSGSGCTSYSNDVAVTVPYVATPVPSGSLTLSSTGSTGVSWVLDGSAPNGLKLVWSTSPAPTYPDSSAKAYDGASGSGTIDATSGTYYVRICMRYDGGCKIYSNEITVTLP